MPLFAADGIEISVVWPIRHVSKMFLSRTRSESPLSASNPWNTAIRCARRRRRGAA